jgi:membrane protein YdbS with pleckstrin-like domain
MEPHPALLSESGLDAPRPPEAVPAAAPVADGTERALDPQSVTLDRVARAIFTVVVSGASFLGLTVLVFTSSPGMLAGLLYLGAWALFSAALAVQTWFWPPLRYRHISYRVDESGIRIRRGVIWRAVTSVPRSRVQHTDVSQGPLDRSLGLASLIIHTAGTQNASVSLGGLRHEDALRVRDFLLDVDERDTV